MQRTSFTPVLRKEIKDLHMISGNAGDHQRNAFVLLEWEHQGNISVKVVSSRSEEHPIKKEEHILESN